MTTPSATVPRARTLPLWVPFLVFAVVWLAHAQTLQAGWVLDDRDVVRDSAVVGRGVAGFGEALTIAWEGRADEGAWRPLAVVSYCVDAQLWRTPGGVLIPFGFHLTNVLLHAISALLLLAVVARLAPGRPVLAAGAALVFAVHPIHASTVTALVGRADLLALSFCLVAVLVWARGRAALLPLAAPAFLFALLAKETAVVLPIVLVGIDLMRPGAARGLRRSAIGYAFLALALFLYFLRAPGPTAPFPVSLTAGVEGLGRVVLGFLAPVGLVEDRFLLTEGGAGRPLPVDLAAVALLGAALLGLVLLLGRRRPGPFWIAALVTAAAGLVGAVFAPAGAPLEMRFAYLTAPALFLWAGLVGEALVGRGARVPALRLAGGVAAALILLLLGAATWGGERRWRTDEAWHASVIEDHPAHLPLQLRFAERLREAAEADVWLAMALPATSERREPLLTDSRRRHEESWTWAAAAARRVDLAAPNRWTVEAFRQLGFAELEAARPAAAVEDLQRALAVDPDLEDGRPRGPLPMRELRRLAETWLRLGRAWEALGEQQHAADAFRRASDLTPQDVGLLRQAARALVRARRPEEAVLVLERVLALEPSGAVAAEIQREIRSLGGAIASGTSRHLRDAAAAEQRTEYREALALYEAVLARDPESIPALYAVARLRGVWFGNYRQAREALDAGERVLQAGGEGPDGRWRRQFRALREALAKQQAEEEAEERNPRDDERDDR